jgi:methionine-S-sulfoxide reductase
MKTIYLAGGCFWGLQKFLDSGDGIIETEVGYANGPYLNPTYEEVRYQQTGHAETCRVQYDEEKVPLSHLLERFLSVIDPFSTNKQGEDEGIQYRSGIYYTSEEDLPCIQTVLTSFEKEKGQKTAVEILPLKNFSPAEEYHQKYLEKNPGGYCHIHCIF